MSLFSSYSCKEAKFNEYNDYLCLCFSDWKLIWASCERISLSVPSGKSSSMNPHSQKQSLLTRVHCLYIKANSNVQAITQGLLFCHLVLCKRRSVAWRVSGPSGRGILPSLMAAQDPSIRMACDLFNLRWSAFRQSTFLTIRNNNLRYLPFHSSVKSCRDFSWSWWSVGWKDTLSFSWSWGQSALSHVGL